MTRTEQAAAAELLRQDPDAAVIKMTATGNPDFIVIPKAAMAQVRFVEVKAGADVVHDHQQEVHLRLRSQGFQVDVIRVSEDSIASFVPLPAKRRSKGDGGLIRKYGTKDSLTGIKKLASPYWYALHRVNGKTITVNTKRKIKAEAIAVLRQLMVDAAAGVTVVTGRCSLKSAK